MAFVVFAGQSNALGYGMSRGTLPEGYGQIDWLTWIWNNESGGFEMMVPGVNTGTDKNPEAWGPEVAFARAFREANPFEPLFIVKSAKGSTGLWADPDRLDWSPQSQGEMFDITAERVAQAQAALGGAPVDAVFIVQGEQDAFVLEAAQAYEANFANWLAAIREAWMHDHEGRIAWARINDAQPHFETVRWAQYVADRDDAATASFDTYDYLMQSDGLHYAADGHLRMGQEFHDIFSGWFERPAAPQWMFAWA